MMICELRVVEFFKTSCLENFKNQRSGKSKGSKKDLGPSSVEPL